MMTANIHDRLKYFLLLLQFEIFSDFKLQGIKQVTS